MRPHHRVFLLFATLAAVVMWSFRAWAEDASLLEGGAKDASVLSAVGTVRPVDAQDASIELTRNEAAPTPPKDEAPKAPASADVQKEPLKEAARESSREPPADVRLNDKPVFTIRAARGGRNAKDRAAIAAQALQTVAKSIDDGTEIRLEEQGDTAVIVVGTVPVITLGPEDVEAAGESSVHTLAASVQSRIKEALRSEHARARLATNVFSISLVVFSALIAFFVGRRVSESAVRVRKWLTEEPAHVSGLKIGNVELISVASSRGALSVAVSVIYRLAQVGLLYGWVLFTLSLFDATKGYTRSLTGVVVTPIVAFASRIGHALPMVVIAIVALFALTALVRFVGLFFDSVARGETEVLWLSADMARPASVLVQIAIVVVALLLATPLITGAEDGALSRVGIVAFVGIVLGLTPIVATAAVGAHALFGKRIPLGSTVEVGARVGRVRELTLFEIVLEDPAGCEVRVPHLLTLIKPTKVFGQKSLATVHVSVDSAASQIEVFQALSAVARSLSPHGHVELVSADRDGAHYRVTSAEKDAHGNVLLAVLLSELQKANIALGRRERTL